MFGTIQYTLQDPERPQEVRLIEDWTVIAKPANDPAIQMWCLSGRVVSVDGCELPFLRLTTTSPIKHYTEGTVTTCSGSTYLLGQPARQWTDRMLMAGHESNHIPEKYLNSSWLDGDNWKTI